MNLLAGGLFSGICYRWPVLGLAALLCVAGYLYSQSDQTPAEIVKLSQDWSPTVIKETPSVMSVFGRAALLGESAPPNFVKPAAQSQEPLRDIRGI